MDNWSTEHVNASKGEMIKVFRAMGAYVFPEQQEVGASSVGCLNSKCNDQGNYEESFYNADEYYK